MSFAIHTCEIRWFNNGNLPEEIVHHLKQLPGKFEGHPERTDVYFLLKGAPDLGIKLREGRVELKKRTSVHDDYDFSGISGQVESWRKWSIQATGELNPFHPMFQNPKHWVNIRKTRSLVKFGITNNEMLVLPPEDRYPENGITLEASVLEMKKVTWWTVGLECYGAPENVHTYLLNFAPKILKNLAVKGFSRSNSFGYPEWISQFVNP
jgi:hypothetical protein